MGPGMISAARRRSAGGGDPNFSAVVLLCGFEGTNGSTSFVDESSFARTLTAFGSAQIDTSQAQFGVSSVNVNAVSSHVVIADSDDFYFPAEFTIEGWIRWATLSNGALASQWRATGGQRSWNLRRNSGNFSLFVSSDGTAETEIGGAFSFSIDTWYHVAADRDSSGDVRVYVDGSMIAKSSFPSALFNTTREVRVGSWSSNTSNQRHNGWVDEVRITKGAARYASDSGFTVPTVAFPRS